DGFLSTLKRARRYNDNELNLQIDIFLKGIQHDEQEFNTI
ncbi:unnamed protein product, partial [Didymodactylos carnosus]